MKNGQMPVHTHDCDTCVFLGHREGYDVYLCPNSVGGPTLLARWSSNGPDYANGSEFITSGMFFHRSTIDAGSEDRGKHFPAPVVRKEGERAPWTNVVAAVFVEYVLSNVVLMDFFKHDAYKNFR